MSLFDKIFRPQKVVAEHYFKTLTAYQPNFRSWRGSIYESELVRSAIDAKARYISKLSVKISGAAKPKLQTILKRRPNQYQTWSQFLYRTSTILDMQNNVFIVPILDIQNEITGIWTCLPEDCSIMEDKKGTEWLRYRFRTGDIGAVELSRCGILTKFQYHSDFFGDTNHALEPTLDLIEMYRQGIKEAIKNAASFRFMARMTNFKDPEDIATEQKNFTARNLKADASGFLLFPNTYDQIQKIESKPFTVDPKESDMIRTNVFDYFGVSEDIIQNKADSTKMNAFFTGAIEPVAIQMSEVLKFMFFSDSEIGHGANVTVSANQIEYMPITDKMTFIASMSDRGFLTINEGRELLGYEPIEGGDKQPIRGEYHFVGDESTTEEEPAAEEPAEGEGNGEE